MALFECGCVFDAYGGEWFISVSRIEDTYDYIDDNDKNSRWFCTVYDSDYDVFVIVVRMHPTDGSVIESPPQLRPPSTPAYPSP
ncbi:hypothetical protein FO519_005055 [Halicephalobus sp. NKZ332]|nr:hypothetical protein FO519_005055 [Halicephalobus sp. NKZ332]